MLTNLKPYVYKKGENSELDAEFRNAQTCGNVKPGQTALFWKSGLRWYTVPLERAQRIFRRVVPVYGKVCCGSRSFIMEKLVLLLKDGTELELYIGDDMERQAAALLQGLQTAHPEIRFGKPTEQ